MLSNTDFTDFGHFCIIQILCNFIIFLELPCIHEKHRCNNRYVLCERFTGNYGGITMDIKQELIDYLESTGCNDVNADDYEIVKLILFDNDIDGSGDRMTSDAIRQMHYADMFIGLDGWVYLPKRNPLVCPTIFCTQLYVDPERKTFDGLPYHQLIGYAYIPKSVLINNGIDSLRGIGSVSCSILISHRLCNICGSNCMNYECDHVCNLQYDGIRCCREITRVHHVCDWSCVMIDGSEPSDISVKTTHDEITEYVTHLEDMLSTANETIHKCEDVLRKILLKMIFAEGEAMANQALAETLIHLNAEQLMSMYRSLSIREG